MREHKLEVFQCFKHTCSKMNTARKTSIYIFLVTLQSHVSHFSLGYSARKNKIEGRNGGKTCLSKQVGCEK